MNSTKLPQYGSHAKVILNTRKLYLAMSYVTVVTKRSLATVKGTIETGYTEELKSPCNCLRNTIKISNYDYLLTTACQISI